MSDHDLKESWPEKTYIMVYSTIKRSVSRLFCSSVVTAKNIFYPHQYRPYGHIWRRAAFHTIKRGPDINKVSFCVIGGFMVECYFWYRNRRIDLRGFKKVKIERFQIKPRKSLCTIFIVENFSEYNFPNALY